MTHPIDDGEGAFVGAMLVARNLGYMNQVHSTLNYSRKLAALGRLMAGVAHEVKNPLNAMTIHLELLKGKLEAVGEPVGDRRRAASHVIPRASERRQARRSHLHRDPAARSGAERLPEVRASRRAQAAAGPAPGRHQRHHHVGHAGSGSAPGDGEARLPGRPPADQRGSRDAAPGAAEPRAQRLPGDARRRHAAHRLPRRVARPRGDRRRRHRRRHRARRTCRRSSTCISRRRRKGSGIGLSMVYRIVQLHDGEVEVQSTPGRGTRFRLVFPQA